MKEQSAPSLIGRIFQIAARSAKVGVLCGVLLHLTLRDSIPGLAVLYYALPRSVLVLLAMFAAVASLALHSRLRALAWFATSLAIAAWWHSAEWHAAPSSTAESGVRVMYWNVCRGAAGWDAVMRRIEYERPDLVALGETSYPTSEFRTLWRERFPDYEISFVGGGMMCLVRGDSRASQIRYVDQRTQARELDVTIDGVPFRCLIVDVHADPLYDRGPALSAIARIADQSADRPVIVLGDFNTPVDSVHFRDLRRHHVNAFEQAGAGYVATWPAFAPVLSLDQIWANRRTEVVECHHGRTSASDHRPVLMTVRSTLKAPRVRTRGD